MFKLSDFLTDIFVFVGFAAVIDEIWMMKEIEIYGEVQPSVVDGYFCIALAISLTILLSIWRNSKKNEK